MKLKTLKDIKLYYSGEDKRIIREEAIKWVKKWQKQSWTQNPEPAEAFIDFFNITEEDLK